MSKRILVVGGGVAGLSAGCYARMNGYEADVYELHDKPGGLCTSWKRQGYMIDGCLHWLVGSAPAAGGLYQCWKELGGLTGRRFVDHEVLSTVVDRDGRRFMLYTDIDRLERHMRELAPEDGAPIAEFCGLCRKLAAVRMPLGKPKEIQSAWDKITGLVDILPLALPFMKYQKVTIHQFAQKFQNPFLRAYFPAHFEMPDFPLIAMAFAISWLHNKCAGYPIGGSLEFSEAIARRLTDLGGRIHYRQRVAKVIVEDGRAAGIRLADGTEERADLVISAADGHFTVFEMLDGRFIDEELRRLFDQAPRFPGLIQASFGIKRTITDVEGSTLLELKQPMVIGGKEQKFIMAHNYSYDPTAAPEGRTVLVFRLAGDYGFWKKLKENPAAYAEEKEKVANTFTGWMESRWPGISEDIEMIDVATPTTFERYTNNWEGSMEGWMITTGNLTQRMKKTLPGLRDFYMVGQWVSPGGGLPSCCMTAREVLQLICHADGKGFVTTNP